MIGQSAAGAAGSRPPEHAPSKMAWSLLTWTKGSASNMSDFFRNYFADRRKREDTDEVFDPCAGVSFEHETVGRVYQPLKIPDAPGSGRESSEADAEAPAGQ